MRAGVDHDRIAELFAGFGAVAVRRMFGGAGIFAGGVMIGLVSDGAIYLKAGPATIPDFEREGLGPFAYSAKGGKRAMMSYWRMPDRLYDDPEELVDWARRAYAAALSAARRSNATPAKRPAKMQRTPARKTSGNMARKKK